MSNYMIPTSDLFLDLVAKTIARNDLLNGAMDFIGDGLSTIPNSKELLGDSLDQVFEELWITDESDEERTRYRENARSVIAAINMKMMTL